MMGTMRKTPRGRAKQDKRLPYTYEAWVDITAGEGLEPIHDHYFSKTICGLIEYLDEKDIGPDAVRLFGVFRGRQTRLDSALCSDEEGRWLKRPDLCRALEERYGHTHEECYRGHVEKGSCAFADRDRKGSGPVW
jgi:hypothetical protein